MTRTLSEIPRTLVDPLTGAPAWGSYLGAFRRTEVAPLASGRVRRLATEKRWVWGSIAQSGDASGAERLIAWAIVDLGYAASAFAFVWERGRGLVVDRSLIGVPRLCRVRSTHDARIDARFTHPRGSLRTRVRDGEPGIELAIELPELEVHATLDERGAPPALTAVAPVPGGIVNTTEKRVLLPVRGAALVAGRRVSLDGAVAGYDHTHGLLARRTRWNWAFGMGRATSGERVALNLVQGFVGEPECAVWVDDAVVPVPEGRFDFQRDAMERSWRIRTEDGAVDLRFEPGGVHRELVDLGLLRSRFVQPAGAFHGTLRAAGKLLAIEGLPGVVEDQDVVW